MAGKGKVGMSDFELLKVLGTGGKFSFYSFQIYLAFNVFVECVILATLCQNTLTLVSTIRSEKICHLMIIN